MAKLEISNHNNINNNNNNINNNNNYDNNNNKKIKELKLEFQRLSIKIIENNDINNNNNNNNINNNDDDDDDDDDDEGIINTINRAIEALIELKEIKLNNKNKSIFDQFEIPDEFRCPISKEIMKDPVVLSTGQTYDRPFIHKWLKDGHRTCPQTQQVLSHTVLTPNHLVRELIAQWCKDHGIQLPPPVKDLDEGVITDADRGHLNSLLDKLSSTLPEQKQAAREIRLLTKRMPSFRSFFGESIDAIPQLLNPLALSGKLDDHPDLQEDLVTVILNLSIHDNNKQIIGEHPLVIPLLIESLTRGTIDTRSNAAAALFTLSALDSNKILIGKSGALRPLIDLLDEGHPLAMKDSASAIFNLCIVVENRGRAVRDGAIRVILHKIMDGILVDELLSILAVLATHQVAVEELSELGAVKCLLGIIRGDACDRNKENCIAILHSICINNRTKLKEVRDEEKAYCTISKLSQHGTSRAKRKANSLLDRLYRGINLTHTA